MCSQSQSNSVSAPRIKEGQVGTASQTYWVRQAQPGYHSYGLPQQTAPEMTGAFAFGDALVTTPGGVVGSGATARTVPTQGPILLYATQPSGWQFYQQQAHFPAQSTQMNGGSGVPYVALLPNGMTYNQWQQHVQQSSYGMAAPQQFMHQQQLGHHNGGWNMAQQQPQGSWNLSLQQYQGGWNAVMQQQSQDVGNAAMLQQSYGQIPQQHIIPQTVAPGGQLDHHKQPVVDGPQQHAAHAQGPVLTITPQGQAPDKKQHDDAPAPVSPKLAVLVVPPVVVEEQVSENGPMGAFKVSEKWQQDNAPEAVTPQSSKRVVFDVQPCSAAAEDPSAGTINIMADGLSQLTHSGGNPTKKQLPASKNCRSFPLVDLSDEETDTPEEPAHTQIEHKPRTAKVRRRPRKSDTIAGTDAFDELASGKTEREPEPYSFPQPGSDKALPRKACTFGGTPPSNRRGNLAWMACKSIRRPRESNGLMPSLPGESDDGMGKSNISANRVKLLQAQARTYYRLRNDVL